MPDTKVSALTDGTTANSTDRLPAARTTDGGITWSNVYVTPGYIKTATIGAGSVSIASGKTFTLSNTLTLAGTDSTTMTFPSTSATLARTDAGNTFTGAQTIADAANPVLPTLQVTGGSNTTGTALTTVAITGTGGQFSCDAATLVVGQNVTISGTLGGTGSVTGYSSPTTYTISATNGSTTFTLVNASTGAALTTTAGTPTGLTYTVASPVLNLTQTWNNSAVTFTGLKFNATNTLSASGSLLLDLQVGGTSQVRVSKAGSLTTSDITVWSNQTPGGTTSKALWSGPNSTVVIGRSGTGVAYATGNGFGFSNSTQLIWGTDESGGNGNLILTRAANATLQLGAADAAGSAIAINSVASNQLTLASNHGLSNGAAVIITGTAAPSGTTLNTLYYARSISAAVIELYDTYENAITTSGTTGRVSVTTAGTSASVRLSTPFQTFQPQSFTGTDIPGQPFIIKGSRGTGTGAGGSLIFQVAPAGSSGTAQNAYSTALTIDSAKKITTYGSIDNSTGSATALQYSAGASQPCFGFGTAAAGFGIYGGLNAGYFYGPTYGGATGFGVSSTSALGFCVSTFPGTGMDVTLFRDNSNILALRNGTSAQLFRVYSTFNGTNDAYGAIGAGVKLDGTYASGDENILYIGSQKKGSPTALTKLAIQVDGTTRADYGSTAASTWTFSGTVKASANVISGGSGTIGFDARAALNSPSDGVLVLYNWAGSDFGRLQFGGTTSSFPALKRVSANLQVIAADGTASAGFIVGNQALATTATDGFLYIPTCAGTPTGVPTTQTGTAPLVVDSTGNKLYVYVGGAWTAMN